MIKRSKLYKLTGGKCWYCGQPAQSRDHVIPRSKGGTNIHINLVPACHTCNTMKGDHSIEGFRQSLRAKWERYQRLRLTMKRSVALIGATGFQFYFEIAGLAQPTLPLPKDPHEVHTSTPDMPLPAPGSLLRQPQPADIHSER